MPDFALAVEQFMKLVNGLEQEVASQAHIDWKLEALEVGSAIITIRGVSESHPKQVQSVITAYEKVGRAIQRGRPLPYGERIQKPLEKLRGLLNGRITSLRLETDSFDAEVFAQDALPVERDEFVPIFGAVEGRIQSLSNRGSLRFTLYDANDDHAVSCYLRPGCEDKMRNAWGKMAIVEGRMRRDPKTGKVSTVRDVTPDGVSILVEDRGDWREAIGCAPAKPGSISPEEAIRRGRDE